MNSNTPKPSSKEQTDINLPFYHQLLFEDENDDPFKSAHIQRKCLAQMLHASFSSFTNAETCDLLESKLHTLTETVQPGGRNIYDAKLKALLAQSKRTINPNVKSNLDKVDVKRLIKPLACSEHNENVLNCEISEKPTDAEFEEFFDKFWRNREKRARPLTAQFTNFKEKCPEGNANSENTYPKNQDKPSKITIRSNQWCFKTARDELQIQHMKKINNQAVYQNNFPGNSMGQRRKLGGKRGVNSKFISPLLANSSSNEDIRSEEWPPDVDERLKNIEPKMVELIKSEIMDCGPKIHWNDIAGLEFAKNAIQEAVVWPMLRPDIFTGLRRPPKGILLFGPPGTGKTLIGKCVASQSKSTFFSISASSLTSKWIGDGEKMVRALFTVARVHQPAVIFIDEIDSLLSQRNDTEHESSRRIKTEFLVQLDGATTDSDERLLLIAATNRPQELDEAARRRFVKRLYIPLPQDKARLQLVEKLVATETHRLTEENLKEIATMSDGYSGADIRTLCSEASLGPIRSIDMDMIEHVQASDVRPLLMEDFRKAFNRVRSSVAPSDLDQYVAWDKIYGSGVDF